MLYEVITLGYKSREMAVGQSGELNVQLEPGSYIEEVVVQSIRASDKAPVTHTTLDKREIQKVYKGEHPIYFLQYLTPGVLTESESGTSIRITSYNVCYTKLLRVGGPYINIQFGQRVKHAVCP